MFSSFSCDTALGGLRQRWRLTHSRAKKGVDEMPGSDMLPTRTLPTCPGILDTRYQSREVAEDELWEAFLRDEAAAVSERAMKIGSSSNDGHVGGADMQSPVATAVRQYANMVKAEERHRRTQEPPPTASQPREKRDAPTPMRAISQDTTSTTAEPEPSPPTEPKPKVQYTPGGRAIPAVPPSMRYPMYHLKLSYPGYVTGTTTTSGREQRNHYTRMMPLPSSKGQSRGRSRYAKSKPSSMASTPISEDEELPLHGSEDSKPLPAEPENIVGLEDAKDSNSSDVSTDSTSDRSGSNSSASSTSEVSPPPSVVKSSGLVEYVEDSQLLSDRRQQLKRERGLSQSQSQPPPPPAQVQPQVQSQSQSQSSLRHGHGPTADHHPMRSSTYPPLPALPVLPSPSSMRDVDGPYAPVQQVHPAHRNTRRATYSEAPMPASMTQVTSRRMTASGGSGGSGGGSGYSLHQRTMLSQWRAGLAAESAQQAALHSPWTAPGGDAIAAAESSSMVRIPKDVPKEAWRERRTNQGRCGWGSRGETRMLSTLDPRELEVAHREVLRRMQAGANRRLEQAEAC